MYLKQKTKTGLCKLLEYSYGFMRTSRDIFVFSYDEQGFICSFSVKLGAYKLCFSWSCEEECYEVSKELTYSHNTV